MTENPDQALTAAAAVPAVVGRKNVGAKGTSTVVYVGIPLEDVLMTTGNNSAADFFHATLVYAGHRHQVGRARLPHTLPKKGPPGARPRGGLFLCRDPGLSFKSV